MNPISKLSLTQQLLKTDSRSEMQIMKSSGMRQSVCAIIKLQDGDSAGSSRKRLWIHIQYQHPHLQSGSPPIKCTRVEKILNQQKSVLIKVKTKTKGETERYLKSLPLRQFGYSQEGMIETQNLWQIVQPQYQLVMKTSISTTA